jgi:hypothetical protein
VADRDRKGKKGRVETDRSVLDIPVWSDPNHAFPATEEESLAEYEPVSFEVPPAPRDSSMMARLEWIKESHALLGQFNPKELKTLMNLKRNTSPKAWTLREDLMVLSLTMSNKEIAGVLKDRNKEAVKKRLQLLRSKGLLKRSREPSSP